MRKSPLIRHVRRKEKRPPPARVAERRRPKVFLHFRKTIPILPNGVTGRFDLYNHANLFVVWVFPVVEEQFNPDFTMHLSAESAEKSAEKNKDYRFFSAAVPRFNKTEKQVATERLPVHPATNRKEVTTLSDDRTFTRTPHYKPQGSHHLQFDLFHFQSTK